MLRLFIICLGNNITENERAVTYSNQERNLIKIYKLKHRSTAAFKLFLQDGT